MTSPEELRRLQEQNERLHEQVKLLVQLDRRLFQVQLHAERHLKRIQAVNNFALQAAVNPDPAAILQGAVDLLLTILPMDQAIGFSCLDPLYTTPLATAAVEGLIGHSALHLADQDVRLALPAADLPLHPCLFDDADLGALDSTLQALVRSLHVTFDVEPDACPRATFAYVPLLGPQSIPVGAALVRTQDTALVSVHDPLPGPDDLPFLQLVGSHVGIALQNAQLHNELSAFAAELEQRVEQRTAELANAHRALDANTSELQRTQDQLLHAGKMAAIGTLVAGLSHELNNPITVILGFAQGLLRQLTPQDPSRGPLEAIERQARRCATLVHALLDFSRKQPLARERYPLHRIVQRVLHLANAKANARGVELSTLGDLDALPPLYICVSEIESALLNLVNNAIDASRKGGAVRVRVRPEATPRPGIEIRIEDDGVGIPPQRFNRIFDPFFTTKPVGEGTGLGLALTRKIVESHGGTIHVESALDLGTTMRVWLPIDEPGLRRSRLTP